MPESTYFSRLREVFLIFLKLGVTSFGGPVAHLGYFHEEVVRKRRWLDEAEYADLIALCQFLPGPASSQAVFALGLKRAGVAGGFAASLGFTLPSAVLMIAFGYGLGHFGTLGRPGWLQGLKVAAVAVVAWAIVTMARNLCPDFPRAALAMGAAILASSIHSAWSQIAALGVGAICGGIFFRQRAFFSPPNIVLTPSSRRLVAGAVALGLWACLLLALPAWAESRPSSAAAVFDSFYRAGSLVFGGGHVVLPLLRAEVVPKGWVNDNVFMAGYGAVQAVPGPLFTFAAFLGTVARAGTGGWLGGLWALLAIFLPAWLLVGGALPFWDRMRASRLLRAVMLGTNAAVVGVLLGAFYRPVWQEGIQSPRHFLLAALGFAGLAFRRLPPWALVLGCAAVGQLLLK
jgi:chromate transporter